MTDIDLFQKYPDERMPYGGYSKRGAQLMRAAASLCIFSQGLFRLLLWFDSYIRTPAKEQPSSDSHDK